MRVRVCVGRGTGSPGKPQGYPWQSLMPPHHYSSLWPFFGNFLSFVWAYSSICYATSSLSVLFPGLSRQFPVISCSFHSNPILYCTYFTSTSPKRLQGFSLKGEVLSQVGFSYSTIPFCPHCSISFVPLTPLFLWPHSPLSSSPSHCVLSLQYLSIVPLLFYCPFPLSYCHLLYIVLSSIYTVDSSS